MPRRTIPTASPKRQADRKTSYDDARASRVKVAPTIRRRAKTAAGLLEKIVHDIPNSEMNCEAKSYELGFDVGAGPHGMETWYSTMFYIDCSRVDILKQAAAQARRFAAGLLKAAKRIDAAAKP